MQALVDRVPALFHAEQANVRVLDRQQLQETLPQEVLGGGGRRADGAPPIQRRGLRCHGLPMWALGSAETSRVKGEGKREKGELTDLRQTTEILPCPFSLIPSPLSAAAS